MRTHMLTISIALLTALLGLAIACSKKPSDDTIAKDIQDKIAADPDTKDSQVNVAAKDAKVTMTGQVKTPAAQQKIEQIAREEPGAAGVDDQTAVQPDASAAPAPAPAQAMAPPPPPVEKAPEVDYNKIFTDEVRDAYFDFNKADIRPDARAALAKTADLLRNYPQFRVTIEGHCDERGSTEYNLALGDRRAGAVKQYLVSLGISADRMTTVSFGKEKPFCTQSNETCWQQNRRGHFVRAQ